MKGVVLAGGTGSRLYPLTKSINKHCLPVYDRPMIYYPIQSLVEAGITDIILVAGGNHMSQFIDLLGDGSELNCHISYVAQMQPGGIAEAISLVEPWTKGNPMVVILGDNIFIDDITLFIEEFKKSTFVRTPFDKNNHCHVVCAPLPGSEAGNYGVLHPAGGFLPNAKETADKYGQWFITEKPKFPAKEPHRQFNCVTGLYMYTSDVFDKIKMLTPSERGELEVSELNDMYCSTGDLSYSTTTFPWFDCGVNIDHMIEVATKIKDHS
jgi:glucose-1-phosphate thymidylyltransferase